MAAEWSNSYNAAGLINCLWECAPEGSLDFRPEGTSLSLRPAEAARFVVGARPKRPATRHKVVDATIIYGKAEFNHTQ
jgi:hypothetical protein